MATETQDPNEIRPTDIVFDCPFCGKSLAIDCRGAGLVVGCPDCGNKVQVPIPPGVDVSDFDATDEEQEVRIIHMREIIAASQQRIRELEEDLADLHTRRDSLEQGRAENALRFDAIAKEVEAVVRSLHRISEVLESAAEASRKAVPHAAAPEI
jgi:transcription elongation factor Elf1